MNKYKICGLELVLIPALLAIGRKVFKKEPNVYR